MQEYAIFNRFLNQDHRRNYGGEAVQERFRQGQTTGVLHTLWVLHEAKISMANVPPRERARLTSQSFRELWLSLGQRRKYTAMQSYSNNKDKEYFGTERNINLCTPLAGHYDSYNQRLAGKVIKTKIIRIIIKDQPIDLIKIVYHYDYPECKSIINIYNNFWEKEDPLFILVSGIFENLVTSNFVSAEELKEEIARFHWLMAHISPFKRGSASITEVLTDALWLFHGYIPQPIEAGKSLDLEAFVEPNLEKYQAIYPIGKKYTQFY